MNKQDYLSQLNKALKAKNVDEIEEIVAEYEEHFIQKTADGYTEEEISAKIGSPEEIAAQFASIEGTGSEPKAGKAILWVGMVFADLFAGSFFLVLYTWVFVLGIFSLTSAALGVSMLFRPAMPEGFLFIPYIPYSGAALMGISLLALGVLAAVLTIYSSLLTKQLGRIYLRWRKNTLGGGKYPPLSINPVLKDRIRRRLRNIALVTLIIFGASFVIGYIVLAASAGALEFWHVWAWFV